MSLFATINEKKIERKKVADAAGAILTKAHGEKRAITPEEDQEWNKRMVDVDVIAKDIERLEKQYELDMKLGTVDPLADKRTAGREDFSGKDGALTEGQITGWNSLTTEKRQKVNKLQSLELRRYLTFKDDDSGLNTYQREELRKLQSEVGMEYRALSAITSTAGQDTIPTGFVYNLDTALKFYGGIIDAADYIDTTAGNPLPWPSINDTANTGEGPLTENSAVAGASGGAAEQDPTYGQLTFNAWMLTTGFVLVPIQLLQDSAFDVEVYLREQLTIRIGRRLNNKCTLGVGTTEPNGVITAATASSVTTALPTALGYNDLLNLFHQIDPTYRSMPKFGFMFSDTVLLAIRKIVDSNGRPLFLAGGVTGDAIGASRGDQILGKPYWVNNDMTSNITNNNKVLLAGDFSKYKIRRVLQLQIVRTNERFIDKLQYGFIGFQRFDGNLLDAGTHPIKYMQMAVS